MSAPLSDAPEIERCGVCREWAPPILHSHVRFTPPGQQAVNCGPYCPSCEAKAIAVARKHGWKVRVLE